MSETENRHSHNELSFQVLNQEISHHLFHVIPYLTTPGEQITLYSLDPNYELDKDDDFRCLPPLPKDPYYAILDLTLGRHHNRNDFFTATISGYGPINTIFGTIFNGYAYIEYCFSVNQDNSLTFEEMISIYPDSHMLDLAFIVPRSKEERLYALLVLNQAVSKMSNFKMLKSKPTKLKSTVRF